MKKRIALLLAAVLLFSCLPWSVTPAAAAPEEKSPADDCKILDYVHEEVFEKGDHLGRMENEETLSSYVFLNKDGTRTAYYLDEAVKFVDTDGKIKEKNITLKAVLGGYATTQNDVTLTLPVTMSSGVNLSYKNYQISLVPEGGKSAAPRIVNNAAEYVDFYGADTVLKYTPTLTGVKEDIILESYTGQNTFTFILNTNGLNVYHTKEDRYYLAPGKGTDPVYWLGALEIYDSALNMGTGEMTVEPMMAGQKYKITITVDETWLTAKGRAYPVTVDPSLTINTNSGTNYIEDSPIYSGKPTKNYGTNVYNCAGYISGYGEGRTVVRLSGLINSPTYISLNFADVLSATFYTSNASGSSSTVYLYPLTSNSSWTENNVTWNNVGSHSSETTIASATISGTGTGAFDITSLVRGWKQSTYNKDCGFILIGANTTSGNGALYSSEHSTTSKRPYVTVSYTYTFTLFDTETNRAVVQPRKGVRPGQTRTLSNLGLTIVDTSVAVTWQSSNTAVATVNATTGAVTGVSIGETTITATKTSGNYASVSYTLIVSALPVSGYELKYEPNLWVDPYEEECNCYAYAINSRCIIGDFGYIDPGNYSGTTLLDSDFTMDGTAIIAAVAADFARFAEEYDCEMVFTEIGKYDVCPAGTYKIALSVRVGDSYHWFRQNPDGYWSHKQGRNAVTKYDSNNNLISDPERATVNDYPTFVAYFAITPWNVTPTGEIETPE